MDLMALVMALKAQKMNAAEFRAAVEAYLEENPEAVDQAAIEALFGDQLDGIEGDLSGLKSAISELDGVVYYQTDNLLDFVTDGFWVRKDLSGSANVYSLTTANKIPVTGGSVLYTALSGLSIDTLGNGFVIRVRQFDANDTQVGSDTTFSTIVSTGPVHYTLNASAAKILIMLTTNNYNKQITPAMFQEMNPLIYAGFNNSITNETIYRKFRPVTDQLFDEIYTKKDKLMYKSRSGYIGEGGNMNTDTGATQCVTVYAIGCIPGENYRVYVEQNNDGDMWIGWCAYNTKDGITAGSAVGTRSTNWVEDFRTKEKRYGHIDITIPNGAISFAFSYRQYTGAEFVLFKVASSNVDQGEEQTTYETALTALDKANLLDTVELSAIIKSVNHRGYNTIAPENTIPAFKLSRIKGFKIVETDVRATSDGVPVCLHDDTINRTARNADGTEITGTVYINSITYEQSQTYDFGIWKSSAYAGTKIPSFELFLKTCKYIGLDAYVEIKQYGESTIKSYVDVAIKTGMLDHVSWNCFEVEPLSIVKAYAPTARLGLLANGVDATVISNAQSLKTSANEVFVNVGVGGVNTTAVNLCIDARIPLEAWSVYAGNLPLDPYVTGMITDSFVAGHILYNRNID